MGINKTRCARGEDLYLISIKSIKHKDIQNFVGRKKKARIGAPGCKKIARTEERGGTISVNKIKGRVVEAVWRSVSGTSAGIHQRVDRQIRGEVSHRAKRSRKESERLTSFQGERLDHCRHDCCLLETGGGEREIEGVRERE